MTHKALLAWRSPPRLIPVADGELHEYRGLLPDGTQIAVDTGMVVDTSLATCARRQLSGGQ
jgi:hypothetical protein